MPVSPGLVPHPLAQLRALWAPTPVPAAPVAATGWWTSRWLPPVWAIVVTTWWSLVGVHHYRSYWSGMDLAIFDEAIRDASRFRVPVSTMKSPGFPLWADHFHPALAVVAPLYWVWDDPRVLLIAQAACFGVAAGLLARAGARHLGWPGLLVGALMGLAPGTKAAAVFDFHELALEAPLVAWGLGLVLAARYRRAALALAAVALVKEDAVFLLAGAGVMLWLRGQRRLGVLLAAFGATWTLVVTQWVIPAISPVHRYLYADALHPASIPRTLAASLVDPGTGTIAICFLLMASFWTAHRSSITWCAVLPVLVAQASPKEQYHTLDFHYWVIPGVVLTAAAIDALSRHRVLLRTWWLRGVVALAVTGYFLGPTARPWHTTPCPDCASLDAAVAMIPRGARVGTDVYIAPHLTHRAYVSQMRPPDYVDDLGRPIDVDWVVLTDHTASYPDQPGWVGRVMLELEQKGWTRVYSRSGVVVYRRP